ncbi:hypothetical protein SERLA73DRAFT_178326 [Serpula lacrymans var. lacrymans S7.3]|uniref:Uncharacterized protein n=1 Tax=Serpula lacrymans var. lacrymans (strain S7.3) TaxID=936435 RepID=F8PRA8_SERL3|nr:hypothetical protein SERLA73DRAFT_178326 [Serpula lacrymans var. lacrymans S7.3]
MVRRTMSCHYHSKTRARMNPTHAEKWRMRLATSSLSIRNQKSQKTAGKEKRNEGAVVILNRRTQKESERTWQLSCRA